MHLFRHLQGLEETILFFRKLSVIARSGKNQ